MAEQFKPGERVQLKSGGPIMTVVKYDMYGRGRLKSLTCASGSTTRTRLWRTRSLNLSC
jgi:hypothetical protein